MNNIYTYDLFISRLYSQLIEKLEFYFPKVLWALIILFIWLILSLIVYEFVIYIFRKFKLNEYIDKIEAKMDVWTSNEEEDKEVVEVPVSRRRKRKKLTEKINLSRLTAKAFSYYIFLIFFRLSIVVIWINEVEQFLSDVIDYLPNLFIWIMIWYFWVRFSNTVYDIVYYALEITKHQTSRVIAMWWKIIILFFTIMIVLNYIKIVDQFIINTIFVWFISTLTIWAWIAFWLWWKEVAREILESFKK